MLLLSTILAVVCMASLLFSRERVLGVTFCVGIMEGSYESQRDLSWGILGEGRGMLPGSPRIPDLLRTLNSFGICTQEVLEDMYSVAVSQLCMMRRCGGKVGKKANIPILA